MMIDDFLKLYGLSIDILSELSYESKIGISLKNDLKSFNKNILFEEIETMIMWLDTVSCLKDVGIDYRIKSMDSIEFKYEKYYPDHQLRKVFNDILGFRAFCDDYSIITSIKYDGLRIADMSKGKSQDDGYRGVHIYFQKTPRCYPIEIQFNTYFDRQFNDWIHEYVYKKYTNSTIGKRLREIYENGQIRNVEEFKEKLNYVLSNS